MEKAPEEIAPVEDLRERIDATRAQIQLLNDYIRMQKMAYRVWLSFLVTFLAIILATLVRAYIESDFPMWAGSILVFVSFAAIILFQFCQVARTRFRDVSYLKQIQLEALRFAEETLNEEGKIR